MKILRAVFLAALLMGLVFPGGQAAAQAQTLSVCATGCDYTTLRAAVAAASDGALILVGPGTYTESKRIVIPFQVTIRASEPLNPPMIEVTYVYNGSVPDQNTFFLVQGPDGDLTLENLHLMNHGGQLDYGLRVLGQAHLRAVRIEGFARLDVYSQPALRGDGIWAGPGTEVEVFDSTLLMQGRSGIYACGARKLSVERTNFLPPAPIYANQAGDTAVLVAGATTATIRDSKMSGFSQAVQAVELDIDCQQWGWPQVILSGNHILQNEIGVSAPAPVAASAAEATAGMAISANGNRFVGNTVYGVGLVAGSANLLSNWWGCNGGPNAPGCDKLAGSLSESASLSLSLSAAPNVVQAHQPFTVTATLANGAISAPNGTPIVFEPDANAPVTTSLSNGVATLVITPTVAPDVFQVKARVDNQTVTTSVQVTEPGEDPFVLTAGISPSEIELGESVLVTATLRNGSGPAPDGTEIVMTPTEGAVQKVLLSGGMAQAPFTPSQLGTFRVVVQGLGQTQTLEVLVKEHVVVPTVLKLPLVVNKRYDLLNPGFEAGLQNWTTNKGPFQGHGSGLLPVANAFEGSMRLRLGDPAYSNGAIPVGYGVASQSFTVRGRYLSLTYRVVTYDKLRGSEVYYDSFEVSLNRTTEGLTTAERDAAGCYSNANPSGTVAAPSGPGLVFCGGGLTDTAGTRQDTGWKTVKIDLAAYQGQDVTLYFTVWSRETGAQYYDDRGYYNTWAYVDDVKVEP